ncbi:hypothetical protein PCANC_18765 [Puccinia coronata f. sp. avenae]|uniref:Uncharacterized protein n=1 Tax=Puccinia coronata f. sp. avenae TaxID=200324 RepID=A0A2N5UEC5_9BASI|nr:hypothetical protein PCANC_18765 [Puccinia coronata f. sp. avenae]
MPHNLRGDPALHPQLPTRRNLPLQKLSALLHLENVRSSPVLIPVTTTESSAEMRLVILVVLLASFHHCAADAGIPTHCLQAMEKATSSFNCQAIMRCYDRCLKLVTYPVYRCRSSECGYVTPISGKLPECGLQ